jgi:hypothetical protein
MAGFTGAAGRSGQFATGITGDDPGNSPTAPGQDSLNVNAQQFRDQIPRSVVQTSTLQSPLPSAVGMSQQDAQRMLPGSQPGRPVMLPTANGSSQDSYAKSLIMKLNGLDSE